MAPRPEWLFDRDREWAQLSAFARPSAPGAGLAIVYGRRRQGKTTLLEAVVETHGAHYWQARQQSSAQNLASYADAVARWTSAPAPMRFRTWDDAFAATFALGDAIVLIDEFGYLLDTAPEVASIIQANLTPAALRRGRTRLVLCGSAFAQMRALTGADAPLRGRASLELVVGPFDYRTAASFWGVGENPTAAFRLHALVGGTPGYRQLAGAAPTRGNIDRWAIEHVLSPSSPLHREGRILIAEDTALTDRALYWSVMAAVADGARRRQEVAEAVGRTDSALTFPLRVLLESGWLELRADPFHRNRPTLAVTEPIVRTQRVLIEPDEGRLQRGQAAAAWEDAAPRLISLIEGPHLEWMASEWVAACAAADTVGGTVRLVGPGVLRAASRRYQLDVVATQAARHGGDEVILIGEAKAGLQPMGVAELDRLDAATAALGSRAAATVKRLLVARAGFTAELRRVARRRGDVELADLDRLYGGD